MLSLQVRWQKAEEEDHRLCHTHLQPLPDNSSLLMLTTSEASQRVWLTMAAQTQHDHSNVRCLL